MITLPKQPWTEGDSFVVEETGVTYRFDGEKWLSESGEEADLSGFATKVQLDEVDRTAVMRDDALKKEHDEESAKQSVVNAGVVKSLDDLFWRDVTLDEAITAGDEKLQNQIDELGANTNGRPELPKFKMVAGDYSDWGNGSVAFFDNTGNSTTTMNSTRGIIVSSFDVDGNRWGRDKDCIEYAKHFNGHFNVTSEDGEKTLFNMSPHYNSKCELFYWPGNEEFPHAGYIIQWQGLQSYTVTSRESEWSVGSFYRVSIPEIFF